MEASFGKFRAKENDERRLRLERLDRMHLYSIFGGGGSITYVYIFLAAGLLILLTACINFMNLSTARSGSRAREVGMRKVVGAGRHQLIRQFIGESFIYTILSMVLAFFLAALLIPSVRNITGQALRFNNLGDPVILLSLLGTALFTGFLSGSYPSLFLSAFQPVRVLKGSPRAGGKGSGFRKVLVVFQFSVSIILIISTIVFSRQISYMRHKSLGFARDQVVVVRNQGENELRNVEPFKQLLKNNPRILAITGCMALPHRIGMYNNVTWEGAANDENIAIIHNTVDYDFLETFEIPLLAGRNFSPEFVSDARGGTGNPENAGAIILNETAVKRFGWDDPIGKKVIQTFGEHRIILTVIGVVRDFHFSDLKNPIQPLKIFLGPRSTKNYIALRISSEGVDESLKAIKSAWNQFNPNYPFEYFFYDSVFAEQYRSEERLQALFGYFSVLAVFIGCLGLLGLAAFAAEQKTKEIGIRKILGASSGGMVVLLSRQFTRWVLVASLIAWPVAYFAMDRWIRGFAYHINLTETIPLFLLSAILALTIAWLTVSFQAVKAARRNPIDSLRYE